MWLNTTQIIISLFLTLVISLLSFEPVWIIYAVWQKVREGLENEVGFHS